MGMPPQDVQTSLVSLESVNPRFDFTNGTKINVIKLMNTTVHTHSFLRILELLLLAWRVCKSNEWLGILVSALNLD